MNRSLTDDEITSLENYAQQNDTEPDGTECQWAAYTLELIEEVRASRRAAAPTVPVEPDVAALVKEARGQWGDRDNIVASLCDALEREHAARRQAGEQAVAAYKHQRALETERIAAEVLVEARDEVEEQFQRERQAHAAGYAEGLEDAKKLICGGCAGKWDGYDPVAELYRDGVARHVNAFNKAQFCMAEPVYRALAARPSEALSHLREPSGEGEERDELLPGMRRSRGRASRRPERACPRQG